ncbi:FAD-dependent oxidoreductase [Halococcus sp. IIIV-5B]|uniref:FAD-dependent oxidoreductase n=1 Tax=Halococcus sp. IIIV-5B TaxID=2321230 RepID=UPI000E755007|nr:FAD-dependent oxidoreductase [Halococcus sp. IIIV-5B]RJT02552.1 NAD(P)/FAD-dependent oxidoreductase [Halococcus sp. IIIV-5B]
MSETVPTESDVVVVGGGPAGCSAAVFTARYGLDTTVFDRGQSSLQRCAYLENYLGFPAGIDVATFYDLIHDHAETAGADLVPDMIQSVERATDGGFVVEPQEGEPVHAKRVVAATRQGADYLRPVVGEAAFDEYVHDGETYERFDPDYADRDGSTTIDGLYVVSPGGEADVQVVVAAGRGAHVARTVLADARREHGYPDDLAAHYDWRRREAELTGEWADRDRWRELFAERTPDDHDLDAERAVELREREIDRRFGTYIDDETVADRIERGQDRLLAHIDDDRILAAAREIEAERATDSD